MAGFGDLWNPNLHPRGWHGRFVKSFHLADWLQKTIDNFKPRTFHSNGQAGQFAMNMGHRSPGGAFAAHEMSRIHNDWDEAMDHIRHGDIDPTTKKFIDTMDRHMQPAPEGMILGRTFTPEALGLRPDQLDENNPQGITSMMGNTLQDRGYGITHLGTNDGHGPGKITMTILAPQGTRVAFSGQNANDRGVFLDREQRILVTHVDPDGQGGWYMMGVAEPKGATTGTPESTLQGRKGAGLTEAQREAKIGAPSTVNREAGAPPSAPPRQANVQGTQPVEPAQVPERTPAQQAAKAARKAGYKSAAEQEAKQAGAATVPPAAQAPDVYNGHKFTPAEAKVLDYMGTGSAGHYHTNPGSKAADKKAFEDLHKLGLLDKRSGEKGPGYKPNDEGWKVIHARGGGHGPGSKAYAEEQAAKAAAGAPPAPSEPAPNAPQAPQAVTPQPAPTAPSVGTRTEPVHGPIGGTPTEGKSPSEIAGTPPEPPPSPAPVAPAPQRNFREAFHEANLEFPSPGPQRSQMNKVYAGLTSGKMHPQDALRQTESDIKHNEGLLKDIGPNDPKAKTLAQDITRQQKFADLIAKENNLPREGRGVSPAPPEHLGKPEAAPAPRISQTEKNAAKAAERAAAPGAERRSAGTAAGKITAGRLQEGDKVLAHKGPDGNYTPSVRKTGASVVTVKQRAANGDVIGTDESGKEVRVVGRGRGNKLAGHQTFFLHQEKAPRVAKAAPAAPKPEAAAPEAKKAGGVFTVKKLSPEERQTYDGLSKADKAKYLERRRAGQTHGQALVSRATENVPAKAAPVKAAKAAAPATPKAVSEVQTRADAAGLPNTVTGLRQAAREKKIRGFSTMSKEQLQRSLLGEEVPKAEKALVSPEKLGPHIQAAKTENDAKALMADHTLADLRELAKANGVDLKGKRTKPQVQDAILKHLRGEETTGLKPEHVTESLDSELKKASVVTPDGPEGDAMRKALSEVDQNDPESLRKERDNLEKEAARLRAAGDRPAAHLAQGAADVLGMRAQRISGVEEAAPAKKIEKAAVPAGHEDLGGTKNDLMEIGKREGAPVKTAMTKPQLIKAITDHRAGKEPAPTPAQAARAAKKAAPTGETHLGEAKGRTGKLAGRATPSERIPEGQRVQPQGVRETPAPGAAFTPEQERRLRRAGINPGGVTGERQDKIASALHEDWRKTRLQSDGSFEPRIKTTKDEAWIKAHGTDQVDIANTSYKDLPEDWKAENAAAGKVIEGIISRHGGHVDLNNPKTRLEVGSEIHDAWLSRNEYAKGGPLDVPFKDLPPDEQAKDLDQITMGEKALGTAAKKAAPASRTPAQMAAGKKAVPKGSVKGERAQVPVTTAPRQSEFRKAWDKAQAGADRSKMDPTSVRSMDEVGKDLESGKITPEEGIRRLESDISLNHNEINDINRTIRSGNVQGAELDKLRGQRDKLVSANSHLEHVSRSMHQHFGKERVTPTEVKAEIPANALEAINNSSPEEMKQAAREAGLGDVGGSTGREVFDNAIRKMVQQRYEQLGAKKPSKAAKEAAGPVKLAKKAASEPKPEFMPGGAKHLDAKAIAGDLNVDEGVLKDAQDQLNNGATPGQVAKILDGYAERRRAHAVYINGVWHNAPRLPGESQETINARTAENKIEFDKKIAEADAIQGLANRLKSARRPIVRKAAVPKASEEIAQAKQETKSPTAKKALAKAETAVKGAEQEAENLKQRIIKRHSDAWDGASTRQEAEAAAQNMRGDLTLAEIRDWARPKGITGRSKDDILKKAVAQRFPGPTPQRRDVMAARMEKASQIRNVGEALAQIDQLKNDQATERAMTTRIEGHAKVRNLDPALTKRLVENHGNQSELDKIAAEHGLARNTETAGKLVPYNPHTMQAIDPQNPREGSPVRVISPGFEGTADQRKFQAVKAKVQHAPEARAEMEKAQRVAVGQRLARSHQGPAAEPMLSPEAEKARRTEEVASNMARLNAAKAVATKESPEQLVERLNSFDNPMSREEANAALANHTKAELVDVAKRMNIPGPDRKTKDVLRAEIVQAGPGNRLGSIATRGFSGARPGQEAPKGSTARKLAEEVRASTAEVTKGGSNPVKAAASRAPVKSARIRDFGSGLTAKLGRENGDEKLKLPNGGADQGLLHMDSSIGGLWQDLASDNRVPNSTVNEITDIGHNLGTGKIDVPTARALIRGIKTDNPAIRERINKAVAELDVKPTKYQVPDNTPREIRGILDKLNEIPAYHNKAPGQAGSGETPFQKIVDLVHAIGSGDEGPGGDMKLVQAIQNPHESGDGVYAARKLAHPIAPGGSQSAEVRNWFRSWRNKEQTPSVEVTPPRNTDAALARERATRVAKKAAPKVTQAELKSPVEKVGTEAPKTTGPVQTKGLVEGEGIPISNRLALENKLSNRNTLNALDRAVRHENTRSKVPDLFQTLITQLQNAGIGPNDEPRKSLMAWYREHFI